VGGKVVYGDALFSLEVARRSLAEQHAFVRG
jgi:hypothetical protein